MIIIIIIILLLSSRKASQAAAPKPAVAQSSQGDVAGLTQKMAESTIASTVATTQATSVGKNKYFVSFFTTLSFQYHFELCNSYEVLIKVKRQSDKGLGDYKDHRPA